jgi:hypothetical protein
MLSSFVRETPETHQTVYFHEHRHTIGELITYLVAELSPPNFLPIPPLYVDNKVSIIKFLNYREPLRHYCRQTWPSKLC